MATLNLKLSGLTCDACINSVTRILQSVDDVQEVQVDLTSAVIKAENNSSEFVKSLITEIEDIGYSAKLA